MIIPAAPRATYITSIRGKGEEDGSFFTNVKRQNRDDSFMKNLYGMLDLYLQIGGRPTTLEERA